MRLPPRLAWRRHRLRKQAIRQDGQPLSEDERAELEFALFALLDEDGTKRVASLERDAARCAAEVLAGTGKEGEWWL